MWLIFGLIAIVVTFINLYKEMVKNGVILCDICLIT